MHAIRWSLLVALFLFPIVVEAQATQEFWPELDVYWRPAEHQRTFLELSGSSEREGSKREATVGLYQDYLELPRAFFRAGYRYTFSTRDASYRESRGVLEEDVTVGSMRRLRLIQRTRLEFRWVNNEYSYRVRERLHLQRMPADTTGRQWAPYVTAEVYYDSRYRGFSRLAGRVGTDFKIRGPVSMDVYVARQNNLRGIEPSFVNALSIVTKLNY